MDALGDAGVDPLARGGAGGLFRSFQLVLEVAGLHADQIADHLNRAVLLLDYLGVLHLFDLAAIGLDLDISDNAVSLSIPLARHGGDKGTARFNTQANLATPASLDAAAIGGFAVGALCLAAQRSCRASLHSNLVTITIIETRIAAGGLARARLGIATDERSLTRGHDTATRSIESIASGSNAAFRLCIAADRRQLTALLDLIAAANACPPEAESSTTQALLFTVLSSPPMAMTSLPSPTTTFPFMKRLMPVPPPVLVSSPGCSWPPPFAVSFEFLMLTSSVGRYA